MSRSRADAPNPPAAQTRPPRRAARLSGPWPAVLLGVLCYANSYFNEFAYDDVEIVAKHPRVRSLANQREIWLSDWWKPFREEDRVLDKQRDRLYRPLATFSFALQYALSRDDPAAYHAVNIVLHGLMCGLVWLLAQRLLGDRSVSSIAALIFAVHPLHSEAVANVVGRAEVLAALLLALGILVLLPPLRLSEPAAPSGGVPLVRARRATQGDVDPPLGAAGSERSAAEAVADKSNTAAGFTLFRTLASVPLFTLALLAKETAVCYLLVAALIAQNRGRRVGGLAKSVWLIHGAILLLPLAVYLPLRYVALENHLLRDREPAIVMNALVAAHGGDRVWLPFSVLGHYTRLVLAPAKLSCNYGYALMDPAAGPDAMTLLGALTAAAGIIGLGGYLSGSHTWRRIAFMTALCAASYVLISNTALLIGVAVAERLMYWPTAPIFILLSLLIVEGWRAFCTKERPLHKSAGLLRGVGVALLFALALRGFFRNADWKNNGALFPTDAAVWPESVELNLGVARELLPHAARAAGPRRLELVAQAQAHLETCLRLLPRYDAAMRELGRVKGLLGDYDAAIELLSTVIQIVPMDRLSTQLLAEARALKQGRPADTLESVLAPLASQPASAPLHRQTGERLLSLGYPAEALDVLKRARDLAPEDGQTLRLLADAYASMNEPELATQTYLDAVKRSPDDWRIHTNLARMLAQIGSDRPAALRHAREAYRLMPGDPRVNINLAEALVVNEQIDEALTRFRHVVRNLDPSDPLLPAVEQRMHEVERNRR
ncbi:Tetratricopeptide repeat protein [Phycisphaerae bacterium RAS1]|nr:Tetratricopeptide repeat protein [Phycisphaerae bacterium RAS1]